MIGANPYTKYLGKEDVMQAEIARFIALNHPDLLWWHTVNEGKRTPFEQFKFKQLGGKPGVSDFVILEPSNFSSGLMIEIKYGVNKCTKDQVDFLIQSAKKGFTASVVYDYHQDATSLISRHMKSGICIPGDGIVLIRKGIESVVPFVSAYQVLCKKEKAELDKDKAKKAFTAHAKAKFGTGIKKEKVKSKLFKSP